MAKVMTNSWLQHTGFLMKHLHSTLLFTITGLSIIFLHACNEDGLEPISNNLAMSAELSAYGIFQGNPSELVPSRDFHLYELSTELFTDYAEKQRLIKVPEGQSLIAKSEGLPDFPDGTMLVKTFFYYNDKRDPSKGKKIIETRLMIKSGSKWNVSTYLWNERQTDANLISTGLNRTINWIDENGQGKVISYHVPSNRECSTCHYSSGKIIAIGPKLRNLNIEVTRNSASVNQLTHFYGVGILNAMDPASIPLLPGWKDTTFTLEERGRAYLDVNCAHCHNPDGIASNTGVEFRYETGFKSTRINDRKNVILNRMETGTMPRIGTSIIHEEGLELIRAYIKSL